MRDCKNCKHLVMYDYKNKSYSCEKWECKFEPLEHEPNTKNDLGVDCISRDSAIKALDYDIKCFEFKSGVSEHMDDIAKLLDTIYEIQVNNIKALPSVTPQEPRWIPVSERLPEKNVWVLVMVEQSGSRYQEIMRRTNYIESWTDNIDNYTDEITAWMPLPKPYEPQESEGT